MATLSDLSLKDRLWYHRYRFRRVEPLPWQAQGLPLARSRVAAVTTAGIHRPEDPPFETIKGGDHSYRMIPAETPLPSLVCTHPSGAWNRSGVEADRNLALPLDRLQSLAETGEIGEVAPRHVSFQGSITAPRRLVRSTGPEVARALADDGVHVVILTPV
jgi:D-proline reductase (dithiol) PrdB